MKKIAICPQCNTKVTCVGEIGQKIEIECITCGKKGVVTFTREDKKLEKSKTEDLEKKQKIEEMKLKPYFSINFNNIKAKIIGMIFIIIGIIFLYNTASLHLKIGITSIIIGIFMILMMTEKNTPKRISDVQITLIMITLIIIMFFATGTSNIETFFVLIVLGILIVKEITDEFTTAHLKKRMSVLIFVFILVFVTISVQKIINFLPT